MPKGIKGFQKGNKMSLRRKETFHSEETKKKMRHFHKGYKKGYKQTKGHRRKIGVAQKGEKNHMYGRKRELSPMWQGGKSFEPYSVDWTKTLRRGIRERDHYTCQLCSKPQEDKTHIVHHIDYNKKNCNPDNLITLCRSCNTKVNYNRNYWKILLEMKMDIAKNVIKILKN